MFCMNASNSTTLSILKLIMIIVFNIEIIWMYVCLNKISKNLESKSKFRIFKKLKELFINYITVPRGGGSLPLLWGTGGGN